MAYDGDTFDLHDYGQVYDELVAVVTSDSEYGLASREAHFRIEALGRVAFLAGRLAWLEACRMHRSESRRLLDQAEWVHRKRNRGPDPEPGDGTAEKD